MKVKAHEGLIFFVDGKTLRLLRVAENTLKAFSYSLTTKETSSNRWLDTEYVNNQIMEVDAVYGMLSLYEVTDEDVSPVKKAKVIN